MRITAALYMSTYANLPNLHQHMHMISMAMMAVMHSCQHTADYRSLYVHIAASGIGDLC